MSSPMVQVECDHCGACEFLVYFDPDGGRYQVECKVCGNVIAFTVEVLR